MCMAEEVCSQFNVTEGIVTMGCDRKSALDRVMELNWQATAQTAQFDLVGAIRAKIAARSLTWKSHWV